MTNNGISESPLARTLNGFLQSARSIEEQTQDVLQDDATKDAILKVAKKLTASLEPPVDAVNRIQFSPLLFMSARIAIDLRLFEIIVEKDEAITSAELAATAHAEENLVVRLLRGLTVAGLVDEVGEGRYGANAVTRRLCTPAVQAGIKHWYDVGLKTIYSIPAYFKSIGYTTPADATSGPLQYAYDTKQASYSFWNTQPEVSKNFNTFMSGKYDSPVPKWSWLDYYPVESALLQDYTESISPVMLVDVGGGLGQACQQFKGRFPSTPGQIIVQDLPEVIENIKTLNEGIGRQKYDVFTAQPVIGARCYYFANVFHNWSDQDCGKILANTVPAMAKGYSKLIINDGIVPAQNCSLSMVGRDLGMMIMHSAAERSENQWKALLEAHGLQISGVWHSGRGEGVIEAVLKP